MKKIIYLSAILLSAGLIALSCSKDDGSENDPATEAPTISKIDPAQGPVGQVVTIEGSNFSATESQNTVTFGAATAVPNTATATQLTVTVPEGATSGAVKVTVGGKTATGGTFTVTESVSENSITLNKNTLELFTLDSETLVPTITGTATFADITWSSDDESVATVDDKGIVTGISGGTATITADLGNDISAECAVTINPSVFAVGYEEINGVSVAKIWKNGVPTDLTDGTGFGAATSVFVDGSDTYVCGIADNGLPAAMVWKNGEVFYELTDGTKYGFAGSIFVYDGDVYVIGNEELGDQNVSNATIWKNGITYATLTDGLNANETSSGADIFVNETGIYSAGYEESPQHINGTPKLWEGTILNDLTDETYHGRAYSVYAVGSDVYVAGYEENDSGTSIAKYWKDGMATSLSDGSQNAEARSIFVVGEDVYVAGFYAQDFETLEQAVVWKNNTPTNLGMTGSAAVSVYVYGEDVYVGGLEPQGEIANAIVWKNGAPMELELTEGAGDSAILSIFVR
nr:IPT/TIG domain-containing protein [Allomuricauda sp.]